MMLVSLCIHKPLLSDQAFECAAYSSQRATVSFVTNPDTANGIIIDAVETFEASGYTAKDSLNSQTKVTIVGNGPNDTVGDMEEARIQSI